MTSSPISPKPLAVDFGKRISLISGGPVLYIVPARFCLTFPEPNSNSAAKIILPSKASGKRCQAGQATRFSFRKSQPSKHGPTSRAAHSLLFAISNNLRRKISMIFLKLPIENKGELGYNIHKWILYIIFMAGTIRSHRSLPSQWPIAAFRLRLLAIIIIDLNQI